jgi:hypothetical protein
MVADTADRVTDDTGTWEPTPAGRARWLLAELARPGGVRVKLVEDAFATAELAATQRALAMVADVAGSVIAAGVRMRLLESGAGRR